ncbi:MAG: PIN domain protein [Elusimicrobia bacterium]|nr:PIN domain protein [Elusimicrobiota bacterium]
MKRLRIYVDTSVFGGCFDEEFAESSKRFFEEARQGRYRIVISDVTVREIQKAPAEIVNFFLAQPDESMERIELSSEAIAVRDRYVREGILSPMRLDDAAHVALATVAEVDIIVSWNFKHLVHFEKIRQYNAVNLSLGYRGIEIRSPKEVVHEDEDI